MGGAPRIILMMSGFFVFFGVIFLMKQLIIKDGEEGVPWVS
jgi:hypothetical protein